MNILFRCDAGNVRGSGHLVRCLTLADALARQGCDITFLCRADGGAFLDLLKDRDFKSHILPAPTARIEKTEDIWDEATQLADIEDCQNAIGNSYFDWLVVDHYGLSKPWEIAAATFADKILVIDDLANRPHDCDALLDQNEYMDKDHRYATLIPQHCRFFSGGQYALLRDEFYKAQQNRPAAQTSLQNILIMMGGSDYRGLSLRLVKILKHLIGKNNIGVDVILGQQNGQRAEIEAETAGQPLFSVHIHHPTVSSLMQNAGLAFGAGGTATWEFACLGVPLMMITFADNQIKMAQDSEAAGFAHYIGHFDAISDADIIATLTRLIEDDATRQRMSLAGQSIVDGKGAARMAAEMTGTGSPITLRRATEEDCRDIFEWRNDALTREMSVDSEPVPFTAHRDWFQKSMNQESRVLLIAEMDRHKIGIVRFDMDAPASATISINLNPAWRGRGLGKILLRQSEEMLPSSVRQIQADIKVLNSPSIRAFEGAGYIFESEEDGLTHYTKYLQRP